MRQYASIGLPNMFGAGIGGALMMAKYTNQPIEIHLLIPARTDTTYFHEYIYPYAKLDFIRGRLKFRDLTGVSRRSTRGWKIRRRARSGTRPGRPSSFLLLLIYLYGSI